MSVQSSPLLPEITEEEVATFRRVLEERRREHQELIDELAPNAAPQVDEVAWTTMSSTRLVLDRIDGALDRLAAGVYGACTRCGEAIPAARLEILPYAEACIPCQSLADQNR